MNFRNSEPKNDQAFFWNCFKEDTRHNEGKRWVVVATDQGAGLLLARAVSAEQIANIGKAEGGRVAYFLYIQEFDETVLAWKARGVQFLENPRDEVYGKVVQFADLYGNKWDLIQTSQNRFEALTATSQGE